MQYFIVNLLLTLAGIFVPCRTIHAFQINFASQIMERNYASMYSRMNVGMNRRMILQHDAPLIVVRDESSMQCFQRCLQRCGFKQSVQQSILDRFFEAGFVNSMELYRFATDFFDRPEVLSSILHQDFNFSVLDSHRARAALMELLREMTSSNDFSESGNADGKQFAVENEPRDDKRSESHVHFNSGQAEETQQAPFLKQEEHILQPKKFKSVIVNKNAAKRRLETKTTNYASNDDEHNYGLEEDCSTLYPVLKAELDQFLLYMTEPSALSKQEDPIRPATANVYLRHARLFFGWYVNVKLKKPREELVKTKISLFVIIPDKESKSAQLFVEFILWLRKNRNISDSYEANFLRGLSKLMKYRFAAETSADTTYGEKTFHDIPVIRELRRLHRDANKRQSLSPRSSDEDLKWISWNEYLGVVEALKNDVLKEISYYDLMFFPKEEKNNSQSIAREASATQRRIAIKFQKYLLLAFFSCVPDRQRTFRELNLETNFLRLSALTNRGKPRWIIKHGPQDYKTGGTYGDRPPLVIAPELTDAIDDFLDRWRPCLQPTGTHLFVQPRTGKGLTQDSIYSMVGRCCFLYTGKKTNPHLLRDMIVTHARQSDASEKELEALALYMGHSITMQRTSYDRRTMKEKVAPAVDLLQSMNAKRYIK